MAIDAYMSFQQYGGVWLTSESTVSFATTTTSGQALTEQPWPFGSTDAGKESTVFEIEDFSLGIDQTLNIGGGGSGIGASKPAFNPLLITRKIDKSSPIFFLNACSGTPFALVTLALAKNGFLFVRFDFKLVGVKNVAWSYDGDRPKEKVTFEYGALLVNYAQQNPQGSAMTPFSGGWSRVTNATDFTATVISIPQA